MLPDRVLVYGVTGSGKSTFAAALAESEGRSWVSVDDLTFNSNWAPKSDADQLAIFTEICGQERWILDTAYGKWSDVPLARAQLILGLDYPRWLGLSRLVRRTLHRALTGQEVCGGNRESLRLAFSKDSIILWHFKSWRRKRARMRQWQSEMGKDKVILFSHPREAHSYLVQIRAHRPPSDI